MKKSSRTFKTNVFRLSGISNLLQRRTSWISEQWVVNLGLEAWKKQRRNDDMMSNETLFTQYNRKKGKNKYK